MTNLLSTMPTSRHECHECGTVSMDGRLTCCKGTLTAQGQAEYASYLAANPTGNGWSRHLWDVLHNRPTCICQSGAPALPAPKEA